MSYFFEAVELFFLKVATRPELFVFGKATCLLQGVCDNSKTLTDSVILKKVGGTSFESNHCLRIYVW